eukprot:3480795-Amphidinium_carterae.2
MNESLASFTTAATSAEKHPFYVCLQSRSRDTFAGQPWTRKNTLASTSCCALPDGFLSLSV